MRNKKDPILLYVYVDSTQQKDEALKKWNFDIGSTYFGLDIYTEFRTEDYLFLVC